MKFAYSGMVATELVSTTFGPPKGDEVSTLDNVVFKYPTKFTGNLIITVDAKEGAVYDYTYTQAYTSDDGDVSYLTGLAMGIDKDDSIIVTTTGDHLTGSVGLRLGFI